MHPDPESHRRMHWAAESRDPTRMGAARLAWPGHSLEGMRLSVAERISGGCNLQADAQAYTQQQFGTDSFGRRLVS